LVNPDGSFIGKKSEWILKVAKWGFVYYKAKEKGYIPKVEFTNKLYMPISKETVEGKFIKLTWRFWSVGISICSILYRIIYRYANKIVNPLCLLTMQKSGGSSGENKGDCGSLVSRFNKNLK
jgi:ribosome-associated toxin RatA of RatAB toxin-antitoxin module